MAAPLALGGATGLVASAASAGAVAAATAAPAVAAGSSPTLQAHRVGNFGRVLVDSRHRSLYLLADERGGTIHCTGSCLGAWPPLLVAAGSPITHSTAVRGTVGHVVRGSQWQVTFNGYPVYEFAGDSAPGQANGEGISSFGSTWYLLHARATTPSHTPDR
jgi:predicted lipoprotein with Yx(FWY)xxD motif